MNIYIRALVYSHSNQLDVQYIHRLQYIIADRKCWNALIKCWALIAKARHSHPHNVCLLVKTCRLRNNLFRQKITYNDYCIEKICCYVFGSFVKTISGRYHKNHQLKAKIYYYIKPENKLYRYYLFYNRNIKFIKIELYNTCHVRFAKYSWFIRDQQILTHTHINQYEIIGRNWINMLYFSLRYTLKTRFDMYNKCGLVVAYKCVIL